MTEAHKTPLKQVSFAEDDPCFKGHFDGAPIVPGAYLLAIAQSEALANGVNVSGIKLSKFLSPAKPGDMLDFLAVPSNKPDICHIEWRCNNKLYGQVVFTVRSEPVG